MVEIEQLDFIKQKIKNLGELPGCYLWKDTKYNVIYVGKALKLCDRVRSYLNPNITDLKTLSLQNEIYDLDWIITNTEEEALILEANLVKKYNPKYNIRLKDDKKFPFICVSTAELYPMIYLTRNAKADGNKYFGPYTDVKAARDLLNIIWKIFPIRKKNLKLPLKKPIRPCLNFHIKRCLAPCMGTISVEEYSVVVNEVLKFLQGKKEELAIELRKRMNDYSENLEYEKAIIYRNTLYSIHNLQKKQTIINSTIGDEDILAFAKKDDDGQIVIFEVRSGRLENKKTFALNGVNYSSDEEAFLSFIKLYYFAYDNVPDIIKYPSRISKEAETLQEALTNLKGKKIILKNCSMGVSRSIWKLAQKNAEMNLTERILATKLRDQKEALLNLKEILKLDFIPSVIECYDISHFQGTEPVGSGVMFVDGNPYKQGYRHYKIKSYSGINDPGMIHEVISRRLQRLVNEGDSLPDLIVIDGGLTQLNRATEAAVALDIKDIGMIGLAKQREEIYFPGEKEPYRFPIDSPGLKLLRRIRDEAHRFGITFHRERRNKATLKSILDGIEDIGSVRNKNILKYFSNKKKIKDCTFEELKEVPGIGDYLAQKIYDKIHSKS